ncbi:extracellular solute-binding protein [Kitasatospora terrestris]|uniref:Extracellular solute-binding protein n=1 Tax=Kitasatospora terrestris TaxID=258051 RepID=A0ABP9DCS3_9ACTN
MAAALLLTACGSNPPQAPTGPTGITLTVATSESAGTLRVLAAAFHARHLDVDVEVHYTPQDAYDTGLDRLLASPDAPDLALLNKLGGTAKAGLVRSLDGWATKYGWNTAYPSGELAQWRSTPDGRQLGTGTLWAAPAGFSMTGVYYNREKLTRLGLKPPATRAEFDTALAKAKAAGELPIQLGNRAGHSSFLVQSIVDSVDGAAKTTDWVNGRQGATIDTPGGNTAAATLSDWARKGYFPADANDNDLPTAVNEFTAGKGLFLFDGSWDAQVVDRAMHGRVGFLPFPGNGGTTTAIGTSVAYAVPTRAAHPDEAAAFLDFMGSQEAAQIQFDTGFLPVAHADTVKAADGNVMNDIAKGWAAVNRDNGLVNFFANSTSTMNNTLTVQSRQLLGGAVTPAAYLHAIQEDWQKARTG